MSLATGLGYSILGGKKEREREVSKVFVSSGYVTEEERPWDKNRACMHVLSLRL